MALDEYLFGKFLKIFSKKNKLSEEHLSKIVFLESLKTKLTILARAFSGLPIEIYQAEREGGYKDNSFFLPASMALFTTYEKNKSFYFFRVLYLCIQHEQNLNFNSTEEINTKIASDKAFQSANTILNSLFESYPICENLYNEFILELKKGNENEILDYSWFYGKWMNNTGNTESELSNFNTKTKNSIDKDASLIKIKNGVEEIKIVEVDKKQQEDYVMTHNFEKVETADEHSGTWRDFDGDDELEKHQEALDELNMNFVIRVDDTTHSIYQADFIENTSISESAEIKSSLFYHSYSEWNFSKKSYKLDYCKVYPKFFKKMDSTFYHKTIKENATTLQGLRKMLASVNNKLVQVNKQVDGDEFDLDALNDMFVELFSKKTPSENIYLAKRKKTKDLSILLLLDLSLSSDGFANGNRVIDVEKQVSILFGEILNENQIDFSVQGFYSKTRNFTTFITLKDFDEKWDTGKYKIGAAESSGYTRIGAALRHSGFILDKRTTKNKWVLLISDGKPNDYDKYEGKYGIQDVKKAIYELNTRQINSFAFAIEAQAKYYLPQMFGQNNYEILTTPIELLKSIVKLYKKIKYA